jgi:FMN phosphatase YigB (HAD superfamily)
VGDSPADDVAGATAAGIRAVLLRRDGQQPASPAEIATLADLARVIWVE